jgi:hypothetical protein
MMGRNAVSREFELNAALNSVRGGPSLLPEFEWKNFSPAIKLQTYRGEDHLVATLRGTFKSSIWSLYCNGIQIRPSATGKFKLPILLKAKQTSVSLRAVHPKGKSIEEEYVVIFNDWEPTYAKKLRQIQDAPTPIIGITPAAGFSLISYQQTGVKDFSEIALTAKLTWHKPFSDQWSMAINSFVTALPIHTNQTGISAHFLGVNGRIGYNLPFIPSPWRINLMAGYYYSTMFVTSNAFGYQNIMGPQIYPTIRRTFSSGHTVSAYFKFSPMVSDFSFLSLDNREIAGGLTYSHLLKNGHYVSACFDYSQITLLGPKFTIDSNSQTLSLSYGF